MASFANLAGAGRVLADSVLAGLPHLTDPPDTADVLVLAAIPNGVPVALPVGAALGVRVVGLPIDRTDGGPVIGVLPDVAGRVVIVIDDGVETGSVARAAVEAIRPLRPAVLVLAVPVCSHEAMADLRHRYDRIIAVDRPMEPRDLASHFTDFDTIDEATALRLLAVDESGDEARRLAFSRLRDVRSGVIGSPVTREEILEWIHDGRDESPADDEPPAPDGTGAVTS